jgi:hypothetical protein
MVSLSGLIGPTTIHQSAFGSGQWGTELLEESENPYTAPMSRALPNENPS